MKIYLIFIDAEFDMTDDHIEVNNMLFGGYTSMKKAMIAAVDALKHQCDEYGFIADSYVMSEADDETVIFDYSCYDEKACTYAQCSVMISPLDVQ